MHVPFDFNRRHELFEHWLSGHYQSLLAERSGSGDLKGLVKLTLT